MDNIDQREKIKTQEAVQRISLRQEQESSWIDNFIPDEFSPSNLLRLVLSEMGLHLRFEPVAIDSTSGKPKEDMGALHIDDPREKRIYLGISDEMNKQKKYQIFNSVWGGNLLETSLSQLDVSEVREEEKKPLWALNLIRRAEVDRRLNLSDGENWDKKVKDFGVSPYTPEDMKGEIAKMVEQVIREYPQLKL